MRKGSPDRGARSDPARAGHDQDGARPHTRSCVGRVGPLAADGLAIGIRVATKGRALLELSVVLQAPAPQVSNWVPITALGVSIVSIVLAAISLRLTYLRDRREKQRDRREEERERKRVDIVSSIESHLFPVEEPVEVPYYCCTVTNAGVPGVQIRRVGLRSHGNAGAEIPLQLAPGQDRGLLTRGDSQVWEISLEELQASLSGPRPLEVVAVATDTVGDQYVQDRSKSVPIPLKD